MDLHLVPENDKALTTICHEIDLNKPIFDYKTLTDAMFQVMYKHNGVGLAAPQVGYPIRLFIMGNDVQQFVCVNPEIYEENDKSIMYKEGCLSFPSLYLNISRPKAIRVRYLDLENELHDTKLEGLWARCFQHELDHLNGVVFTDKVSKLKLNMAKRKRRKVN